MKKLKYKLFKISLFSIITIFVIFIGAIFASSQQTDIDFCKKKVCSTYVLSEETIYAWHRQKSANGATFAGSHGWKEYISLIEREGLKRGMVDFQHNNFTYPRWHTTDWPDKKGWSLVIGGEEIEIASYGANSGMTGPEGITADLVLLTNWTAKDLKGKIIVVNLKATDFEKNIPDWIYQPPENNFRVQHEVKPEETIYQSTVSQLFATNLEGQIPIAGPHYLNLVKQTGASGVVYIFDMANDRAEGLFSFPPPAIYDIPTLYLGRESGKKLMELMKEQKQATLKLDAHVVDTEAYQLVGFLPGKKYGQGDDEIIMMISHTDGPSISQENGPFGLLGIVHYFSNFEASQRDKTLMLFLDSRHYIPNREASLPAFDIDKVFAPGGPLSPQHGKIVASVHLEHLGQIEYSETEGSYAPTGRMEMGGFYVTGYQPIIDIAKTALMDNRPKNQFLRSTDIPGLHCQSQGIWFGLGHWPRRIGIEAIASNMTFMGAYWSTGANIDDLNVNQFIKQMNVMTQITGNFMLSDTQDLLAEKAVQPTCLNLQK